MAEDHELWLKRTARKASPKPSARGIRARIRERAEVEVGPHHPFSFLVTSSLSSAGLAWPLVAFITWPQRMRTASLAGAVLLYLLGVGGDDLVDQPHQRGGAVICSAFRDHRRREVFALLKHRLNNCLSCLELILPSSSRSQPAQCRPLRPRTAPAPAERFQAAAYLAQQHVCHAARIACGARGGFKASASSFDAVKVAASRGSARIRNHAGAAGFGQFREFFLVSAMNSLLTISGADRAQGSSVVMACSLERME